VAEGDVDRYAITLDAGSLLKIRAYAPDGLAQPIVRVYDAAGTLLASGSTIDQAACRLADGGLYYIEVTADSLGGDYVLRVEDSLPGEKPAKPDKPGQAKSQQSEPKGNALGQKK
jgi:hypothetical protein